MTDGGEFCPHLDSVGEVTKEELLQKSKASFQQQLNYHYTFYICYYLHISIFRVTCLIHFCPHRARARRVG